MAVSMCGLGGAQQRISRSLHDFYMEVRDAFSCTATYQWCLGWHCLSAAVRLEIVACNTKRIVTWRFTCTANLHSHVPTVLVLATALPSMGSLLSAHPAPPKLFNSKRTVQPHVDGAHGGEVVGQQRIYNLRV